MVETSSRPYILNVEDNDGDAYLLARAFRSSKCDVRIERNADGREAMDTLEAIRDGKLNPPLFILVDLKLPLVTGLELLRFIRSEPTLRNLEVVVFTSSDERRDIEAAYEAGCSAYYAKPIDYTLFRDQVKEICSRYAVCGGAEVDPCQQNFMLL